MRMTFKERVEYHAELAFGFGMVVVLSTASCVFGKERVIRWGRKLLDYAEEKEKQNVRKQKEKTRPGSTGSE